MRELVKYVYELDELDDAAKEKAREWYIRECMHDEWWDHTVDVLQADIIPLLGIEDAEISFSLGYCQSDFAAVEGYVQYRKGMVKDIIERFPTDTSLHEVAREIADAHRRSFYRIEGKLERNRYGNRIDIYTCEDDSDLIEAIRRLDHYVYESIRSEYEYQTSEECVDERLRDMGYEFYDCGSPA